MENLGNYKFEIFRHLTKNTYASLYEYEMLILEIPTIQPDSILWDAQNSLPIFLYGFFWGRVVSFADPPLACLNF